ncbi:hypothetical protein UlMin_023552 [Ulmus minor]
MMSRSYSNLLDLASGNSPAVQGIPRSRTVPGNLSKLDENDDDDNPSSVPADRIIIVANQLPLEAERRDKGWSFTWNEDSLLLHLKDGFPMDTEVLFVGSLKADVDEDEQDDVSQILLDRFNCVPTFLPADVLEKFYDGFCKRHLWPLFHYMLPFTADQRGQFDQSLWLAYMAANKLFYQKIIEVLNPECDYVWIHDYHLMVVPMFLRNRFLRVRMGFFLHSPFPSSEIYRTLPVREEILKALLNSDIIGFHTFDYARHFLSCCSRMLGLDYHSNRGYLGLDYYGRIIGIKIMPVGIHIPRIQSVMKAENEAGRLKELEQKFEGKVVLFGVDDMDIFKGINLKLLAMEQMLKQNSSLQGNAVLIQIVNPARGNGIDLKELQEEIQESCRRINEEFGQPGYQPIVLIDSPVSFSERVAYYSIADCVVVTAVRDGMNLTPYEYIVCRQGVSASGPKNGMLVVSEFIGCSPSLSGAIRVNPWNIEATAEAMRDAIGMNASEQELRHAKHYWYVSTHDVSYWARSFLDDLKRTCKDHFAKKYWGVGFGFTYRVVVVNPNFRKLSINDVLSAYCQSKSRVILLDYDGTVKPQQSANKTPSEEVVSILNKLCADQNNTVFIVSGRGRVSLSKWFSSACQKLGTAAEHGFFLRWSQNEEWGVCSSSSDIGWMKIAEPIMKMYAEATDGSCIEVKETALVWQYRYADPVFGSSQAGELLDHLESVLANEPVVVKRGKHIVEVKPQGVSKGLVAEKIFKRMAENGRQADFVLCIGDDISDEDMFEIFDNESLSNLLPANTSIFPCTVEQKPSKAKYFLDDITEVITLLNCLVEASDTSHSSEPQSGVL